MDLITKIPSLGQNRSLPQIPTPRTPEIKKGIPDSWKVLIFDILAVLLAAATGYGCLLYFSGGANFILFAAAAALFLIASFSSFLLTRDRMHRNIVVILQILAFLGFFYSVKIPVLLSALGILLVFYIMAQQSVLRLSENSLKFRPGALSKAYMKKIFIGFALAAIVLYLPQWDSGTVFVSQKQFQKWYDGFAAVSQRFYAGLDLTASAGTFAEGVIRAQLANNNQFAQLAAGEQEQVVKKGVAEFIANMSKNLGFTLTPEMSLSESVYKYLLTMFTNFKTQFGDSFLAAWAVALFVIVWSVGTIVIWIVSFITYLIFEMFLAFNVVHVAGETRTKEVVEIS